MPLRVFFARETSLHTHDRTRFRTIADVGDVMRGRSPVIPSRMSQVLPLLCSTMRQSNALRTALKQHEW